MGKKTRIGFCPSVVFYLTLFSDSGLKELNGSILCDSDLTRQLWEGWSQLGPVSTILELER